MPLPTDKDGNVDGLAMGESIGRDVVVAAESLAYAELEHHLLEPFRWRNQLQLDKGEQPLTLDGIALPESLQTVALGSGDDRVQITDVTAWSGRIDAGSGSDILDLSAHGSAIELDLSQDSLNGLLQLHDFEQVWGGPGADQLRGDEADEWFQGNGANDWLDGGPGLDTAQFSGVRADYRFGPALGEIHDQRPNGDGVDQLVNIERLVFADGEWSFNHLFRAPVQRISSGPYPLSVVPGSMLQLPVLYSATNAGAELQDLAFELRYPSDQLEFLGVSAGSELQISRAEPIHEAKLVLRGPGRAAYRQRPRQRGARFSRHAAIPSTTSCVAPATLRIVSPNRTDSIQPMLAVRQATSLVAGLMASQ